MDVPMTDTTRTTVSITINGRAIEAEANELIITAAERAGTYVPRFCYHPRMEPVGVCRMCLVEVDGPRGATLQPACYLRVSDGMSVTTDSEKVKKAQDGVLEFLLANHPLDCPVCDKGGECPLQDQTLAHGSGETRFIEEKRHFAKPIEIGELVLLDRERCIQCSRCTRFASEVAGDAQIDFAGRGESIEVAPFPTEPFDSIYSGNTVQICPVGALTAKPYRFTARPWDLEQVESTCTTCSVGCRVAVQSSQGRLTRVLGIDSDAVNHGWLCDKGRFAIDAIDGDETSTSVTDPRTRITEPMVRRNGELVVTSWSEALDAASTIVRASRASSFGAIGGAALTNEGAFAWERFLRGVVHTDNIDAQYGDGIDAALLQSLPRATLNDMAEACTVVVLSGDLREELPIAFLRLRDSVTKGRTNVVELVTGSSAVRSLARVSLPTRPGEAHHVAGAIAGDDSALASLGLHSQGAGFSEYELAEARRLIGTDGAGVVFVVGRSNLAEDSAIVENAVAIFARQFPKARFLPALRRSNVFGALDMGLSPGLRPGRSSAVAMARALGVAADATGRGTIEQLHALRDGTQSALLLLGGCVISNTLQRGLAEAALGAAAVIAVTGHGSASLAYADVILPSSVSHERSGTVTNLEGRVSAVFPKIVAPGSAWSDVAIASELAEMLGQSLGLDSPEHTSQTIEDSVGYPAASVMAAGASDGIVVGRDHTTTAAGTEDPMANPGLRSAELVGLSPRAGDVTARGDVPTASVPAVETRDVQIQSVPSTALADAYALQVVVSRRLYDQSAAVLGSPALADLIPHTVGMANPYDLDRLGVSTGDVVRAVGTLGSFDIEVVVNALVPRGVLEFVANTLADDGRDIVGRALAMNEAVIELRLESR